MTFVRSASAIVTTCLSLAVSPAANAALLDRGGGLIYDSDQDITWLANANLGAGTSYDDGPLGTDGAMTWASAVAWASSLAYYDSVRDVTWTDWRLPATVVPDAGCSIVAAVSLGTGCMASELGHLYYTELGGTVQNPLGPHAVPGPDPFFNLQPDAYWSGTEFDATNAYVLNFAFSGGQAAESKTILHYYAWAVRDGDVSVVPAPPAVWLLGTGVIALAGRVAARARRRLHARPS